MGATFIPERSEAQRLDALRKADMVRTYRADLKKRIKRGEVDVASLLAGDDDPLLGTMKVADLLLAQRGWGSVKVGKVLRACGASPSKTFEGLTGRQRLDLVRGLYGQPPARKAGR